MSVRFVLLARDTAFNVFAHKLHKAWPPEFSGNELTGLEIPGMAGSLVVMAVGKDRVMEGALWRNIDMTFVY